MGGGEKKASIVAKIMQLEFTGNRILVGFILAFDVLQNLLAMSLQHSYLRRLLLMMIAALLSQASYLTGQVYSCPSASERHLISMPTTSGLRGRQITSGMLRCPQRQIIDRYSGLSPLQICISSAPLEIKPEITKFLYCILTRYLFCPPVPQVDYIS